MRKNQKRDASTYRSARRNKWRLGRAKRLKIERIALELTRSEHSRYRQLVAIGGKISHELAWRHARVDPGLLVSRVEP